MGEFPPRDFSLLLAVLGNIEEVAQIFALLLSLRNSCIFMLTKIVLATIWADLFTNETHKVTLFLYIRVARFGRIFACWPIDFFGYFFENSRSSLNIWATFFHGKALYCFFYKNGLGYILGDFITSSSGHPALYLHSTASLFKQVERAADVQQGDQIGRIFGYWATVYFGQLLAN
jgi:hypothetical protein